MLQKKPLYFAPVFPSILLETSESSICQYFLRTDYQFIVSLHKFYAKLNIFQLKQFNRFFLKSYSMHWFRVAFKGKGYRLRKFKSYNKVTLNFGHSHWAKLALTCGLFFFKKIRRQNYLCFAKNYFLYKSLKTGMKFFKKLNSYTKRGLRLKKQFIKKRFGKISQVVSSLH